MNKPLDLPPAGLYCSRVVNGRDRARGDSRHARRDLRSGCPRCLHGRMLARHGSERPRELAVR